MRAWEHVNISQQRNQTRHSIVSLLSTLKGAGNIPKCFIGLVTSLTFSSIPVMNIEIRYIPTEENEWSVTRAISAIIHSEDFAVSEEERQVNFKVDLTLNEAAGVGHNGSGILTVPTMALGRKFLYAVRENPIRMSKGKLKFFRASKAPPRHLVETLDKTPFVSPDIEEKHAQTLWALEEELRVETVQFGAYFRPEYPGGRWFSVEWEKKYVAWLKFEYDHKLIRITVE